MITIWKYILHPTEPEQKMPKEARILTAAAQGDQICVWAEVNPDAPPESRYFQIFGTGHPVAPQNPPGYALEYIGSAFLEDGAYVFHVYEEKH
jgi:hypothetical protein